MLGKLNQVSFVQVYRPAYESYPVELIMNRVTVRRLLAHLTSRSSSSRTTPELGRWNYSYDEKSLDRKIRLANEDHCGVCDIRPTESDTDVFSYIADCCGNGCTACDIFTTLKAKS